MILVTGASGKTGQAVVKALAVQGKPIRAFIHHENAGMGSLMEVTETVCGDLSSQGDLERAVRGIQSIYHICPNMSPAEYLIGQNIIKAAKKAGVEHFVYHSVLHPQTKEMAHHWQKLRVEEYLFKSGLNFSVLQPTVYMQNILAYWEKIVQGIFPVPYAPTTRLGMIALEDVASAAAIVLENPQYYGGIFELIGTPPLSQIEVANILGEQLGFPVAAVKTPVQVWEAQAIASGMPDYARETLMKMFIYYEKFGLWGSPWVLQQLLGRSPVDFSQFIDKIVKEKR
jgi:NAD(P)H dehydrogenase (quinone)